MATQPFRIPPQDPGKGAINEELQLDRPMQDVRHEAVLNIVRTANLLAARGARLFRKHGLTEAQFNVLFALKYKLRPWTQSDLGKRLVVTRASITSVLDKLEEKRLVVRQEVPHNRRVYHVELTAEGRALLERLEPAYRGDIHRVVQGLDEEDLRAMILQLEHIRRQVGEQHGE